MQTMLFKKHTAVRPSPQTKCHTADTVQAKTSAADFLKPDQPNLFRSENRTGMPDHLKTQIEHLSGYSMDDVKVHYNSYKPAQLQALAYTQGTDIHIAPGQEQHLPHEAWHVVQQKQGRVTPTMQYKGIGINDNDALEHEADVMGAQALRSQFPAGFVQRKPVSGICIQRNVTATLSSSHYGPVKGNSGPTDTLSGVTGNPAQQIVKQFKDKIKSKVGDFERPNFQCAEPHALANFLKIYNDDINWAELSSLKFDSVINNGSESETFPPYNMSPCPICRQWVQDNKGLNEQVLITNIITEEELNMEESNHQIRQKQAEKEQQEREEQARAAREKAQQEEAKQKKYSGQLLNNITDCLSELLYNDNSQAGKLLKIAYGTNDLNFDTEQGMWCLAEQEDTSDLLNTSPPTVQKNITQEMSLEDFYDECKALVPVPQTEIEPADPAASDSAA